ncbi:MAG: beta-N-acetylhexosaminidase [Nitrospirae bacterium]|nr:MAG: beta-N-acetylhexosaminidase [Nitrospirota bacterium]
MPVLPPVGQVFLIGFHGTDLTSEQIAWLQELRPGGVILFARNLESPLQVAALTAALQTHVGDEPLLIAIDQEGGRVSRLPKGFTIFPAAATIAACGSLDVAYAAAAVTARELKAVGINMNLAPVLDVNTNPENPVIGDRAFGSDPEQVSRYGLATMEGLHDNGVVACGKHFPGHGDTLLDSHHALPTVGLSRERLETIESHPFRQAIARGLEAIMSAHVVYPGFDPMQPATLSSILLTEVLREQLGFRGVVLTDDLEMRAIIDHFSIEEAAVRALQAGADMILICHDSARQVAAFRAVQQALEAGELDPGRIQASIARIQALKKRFRISRSTCERAYVSQVVGAPRHRELVEKIKKVAGMA